MPAPAETTRRAHRTPPAAPAVHAARGTSRRAAPRCPNRSTRRLCRRGWSSPVPRGCGRDAQTADLVANLAEQHERIAIAARCGGAGIARGSWRDVHALVVRAAHLSVQEIAQCLGVG